MKKRGKNYLEKVKLADLSKQYSPSEAIRLVKEMSYAKFDESVEVHFNLGIDPRQAEQQIRGTLNLPHGTGRTLKIAVIAQGEKVLEAKEAGADIVGSEDLIEKIQGGWFDFDLLITTPDMMSKVGKLGKTLGAKGLMPNPKSGTVTPNLKEAIEGFKAGKIEYRNDKTGIVHVIIGKRSFSEEKLSENFAVIYDTIDKAKPAKTKKGIYIKSVVFSSTMGPGIRVEPIKSKGKEK